MHQKQIASLSVLLDRNILATLTPFLQSAAESASLNSEDSADLADIVQKIVDRLATINSTDEDEQSINIRVLTRSNKLSIILEYKGLPIEVEKQFSNNPSPFSLSIQSQAIDNVRLMNLGKSGQKLELSKFIPHARLSPGSTGEAENIPSTQAGMSQEDPQLNIRLIDPSEGIKLARCFFRVYGFTYGPNYVYNPEHLKTLIMDGRLISAVAVDARGEFCAHAAILLDEPDSVIGELVSLAVDPEYRNAGLAKRIHSYLMGEAKKRKLKGLFGEAVTVHPFSQRLCLALGGKESAVMLGYIPPTNYRQISEGSFKQRQMAVVYFFCLSTEEPGERVFGPEKHAPMIEKIYSHLNLKRSLLKQTTYEIGESCGDTAFDLKVSLDIKTAAFSINVYCPDTIELVRAKLGEILKSGIEYLYLDLPISDSLTPYFSEKFEMMGFFFSGIIPYRKHGDSLRLQFLNSSEVNLGSAEVVSEFGGEISQYVKTMKTMTPDLSGWNSKPG